MKRIILTVLGIGLFFCCFSQVQVMPSVLNSAGMSLQNSQVQLDFSMGEMSISTFSGSTNTIQSGFLQLQEALTVLPLSFLGFETTLSGNDCMLNWQTANEQNVNGFNIQRSFNGADFKNISFTASSNKISTNNYQYIDIAVNNLMVSTIFYRLQEIDKDGYSKYSPISKIRIKNIINYSAFPNPASDKLEVTFKESFLSVEKYFCVYAADGKVVFSEKTTLSNVEINTSAWSKGAYYVCIIANGQKSNQIIIKQ
jgi:hypothetical protein